MFTLHLSRRQLLDGPAERGALWFDAATGELEYAGLRVQLTPTEAKVFEALQRADGLVSIETLVKDVWGYQLDAATAALVRAHVYQLRRRLALAGLPPLVETLPRRGYRIIKPCE